MTQFRFVVSRQADAWHNDIEKIRAALIARFPDVDPAVFRPFYISERVMREGIATLWKTLELPGEPATSAGTARGGA